MNVIFAGQPGLNVERVLANLENQIRSESGKLTKKEFKESKLLGVYSADRAIKDPVHFKSFLEQPDPQKRHEDWKDGVTSLLEKIAKDSCANNFLHMHLVYRKYREFFTHVNWNLIRQFKPDLFITFIDDIPDIWWRLRRGYTLQPSDEFSLQEIIEWRELEAMTADAMAMYLYPDKQIRNFVVGIKHPAIMLAKLVLRPEVMRMYMAYPISNVRHDPKKRKVINAHKKRMHEQFTAFDPGTIDEMLLRNRYKAWQSAAKKKRTKNIQINFLSERWQMKGDGFNLPLLSDGVESPGVIRFRPEEIGQVIGTILHQVETRDYRLIAQSNVLTAYRPNYDNKASLGVGREITFSRLTNKTVYEYWDPKDGNPEDHPFTAKGNFRQKYSDYISMLEGHQKELDRMNNDKSHIAKFEFKS